MATRAKTSGRPRKHHVMKGDRVRVIRGNHRDMEGTVLRVLRDEDRVVVERRVAHPFYGKQLTQTKKYHAHDEKNEYRVGDVVRIVETRPLSKTKRWRVVELIERPE